MERKLKPDQAIAGLAVSLSIVLVFGLSTLIFGLATGFNIAAILIWILAAYMLYIFVRTGNLGHLLVCGYLIFLGAMATLAPVYTPLPKSERADFSLAWIAGISFFGVLILYLVLTKKIKWRGREIFELAAESIDQIEDSYTSRPLPIGKVEFSQEDILSFARFAARNLIALPHVSPRQVVLIPIKMGDEYTKLLRVFGNYRDMTWISFEINGNVSVHISQSDYLDFKEPLAFAQLCEALGNLFIGFIEKHKKGEGTRIIDRMNALKMGYFS